MANFGRFVCVAIPILCTVASLIALLVASLAGVTDKSLYMFRVNTTELQVPPSLIGSIFNKREPAPQDFHDPTNLINTGTKVATGNNITAGDLGIYDLYDIGLWGYCYTPQNGSRACTKPAFNWATTVLNETTNDLETLITLSGQNIKLPKEIGDAVELFGTVSRWTQIVFIIALVSLAVELFFGIFANCSRAFSCVTFIVSAVATTAVCGAAALATATAVVVVGAVETTAKFYGVQGDFNMRYLAAVWIAAAFAIAAGLFWLFTICCCKPDRSKSSRGHGEGEKFMQGPYQPIGGGDHSYQQQGGGFARPFSQQPQSYGQPQRDMAYEPYSHSRA
ncbi:integral membrane protein [Podospora conica]|nr:integral membrane protein [Schizothecium conicum]